MTVVGEDVLAGADAADLRIGERLHELAQGGRHPQGVGVDEHDDLARRQLGTDLHGVSLARDLGPDPSHEELGADPLEHRVARAVDDHDDLIGSLGRDALQDLTKQRLGLVDDGDHDAGGRTMVLGVGPVAPDQLHLANPDDPHQRHEDREQVHPMVGEGVAKLQQEDEHGAPPPAVE